MTPRVLTDEEKAARNLAARTKRQQKLSEERAQYSSAGAFPVRRETLIRLPKSGPARNRIAYCKLLCRVASDRFQKGGFSFEGVFFKPGAVVPESALRPAPHYPATPILLECTGFSEAYAGRGKHADGENQYILFKLEKNQWTELARVRACAAEWALDLSLVAHRALAEGGATEKPMRDLREVAQRLTSHLDAEMKLLEPPERSVVAAILHDVFASQIAHEIV